MKSSYIFASISARPLVKCNLFYLYYVFFFLLYFCVCFLGVILSLVQLFSVFLSTSSFLFLLYVLFCCLQCFASYLNWEVWITFEKWADKDLYVEILLYFKPLERFFCFAFMFLYDYLYRKVWIFFLCNLSIIRIEWEYPALNLDYEVFTDPYPSSLYLESVQPDDLQENWLLVIFCWTAAQN